MPEDDSDDAFLAAFEAASLPLAAFDHRAHVRAGFLYVARYGFGAAIERFGRALRGFAAAHGKHGLYHETITVAYLALINERRSEAVGMDATGAEDWPTFAAANPDLMSKDNLSAFYAPEELAAPEARRVFRLPRRVDGSVDSGRDAGGRQNGQRSGSR